jgi:hypothetical protein
VEPEITPEPSPEERAAIIAALQEWDVNEGAPPPYRTAWRREGILESIEDEGES